MKTNLDRGARVAALSMGLALAACGGGGGHGDDGDTGSSGGTGGGPTPPPVVTCAMPMAPEAVNRSVTVSRPSDFDPTASPTPTPTTVIDFTLLLPERCPGATFPLVLQSHGYGGTRLKSLGPDGTLDPTQAHFDSINTLVQALPYHGYVVISYDERGHGTDAPKQAPHNARIIDPAAETQDAIELLNWAYDNPAESFVLQENDTGIAKDVRVGTIGYSYGGGFEMPLALLDPRVDTIVPNGTWNDLLYSLLPGDGVKLGFDSLLCLLAATGNVNNTPLVANLCNQVGPTGPSASTLRTRADLVSAATAASAMPRPAIDGDELLNFFYTHGSRWFDEPRRDGKTIIPRDVPPVARPASRRAIPALFVQGNRDTLFNLTDGYFNYQAFKAAGADVRLLTTEGGHMNPLANQKEGSANCGGIVGVNSMLAWFDQKLRGTTTADFAAIPSVCLSVTDTPASGSAPTNAQLVGLVLNDVPVGSQTGAGAVPAIAATLTATVTIGDSQPQFAPVTTITQAGAVLAGLPRVGRVSVTAGAGSLVTPVAYVGVGIVRAGKTILVDDEVTPFAALAPDAGTTDCPTGPATDHCHNRGTGDTQIVLPGIGEQLQVGDQVGLLFFQNQVQYLPANGAGTAVGIGSPNPYTATLTNVELPIVLPCPNAAGCLAGSSLSKP